MNPPRVALATGTIHLPQKHYVLDHALGFGEEAEATLFTYAASGMEAVPSLAFRELMPGLPIAFGIRRRLYPLGRSILSSSVVKSEPDIVHLHFLSLGGFAASASRQLGAPLVTTVHALEPFLLVAPTNRRQLYLRDECLDVLQATDLFMPVSSYIAKWLESLGVPSQSIHTNYLGIDTDFWSTDEVVTNRSLPPRLLFVGNLTELKGVVDLIRCSIQLRGEVEHTLEIVGDGPLRDEVNQIAASHGHIEVQGRMDRLGVREAMSRAWCLVLPTRTHLGIADAAPFVLMEAQSMGLPALTFNVGGTAELVASSEFLVAENDFDALRHRLVQVLTLDAGSRRDLGTRVRGWITGNRSRHQGVRVTLDHYHRLLGRP